jgi:N-acyl-D-amino-acid deacylase
MYDVLIGGARVVDGTGRAPFTADVAIAGGRIVRIAAGLVERARGAASADGPHHPAGKAADADARAHAPRSGAGDAAAGPLADAGDGAAAVIDGRGLCLAPGFIDPHTHSDLTLLADPRAESRIRQGVTTEVVGNCGSSPAPLAGAAVAEVRAEAAELGVTVDWTDMGGFLDRLARQGTAVNVVPLVGHNTVRGCVLGYDDVRPDAAGLAAMERTTTIAVEQGARGLSSGLFYPPGSYADLEEVAALARAAGRAAAARGSVYASHIRDEAGGVLEAIEEAMRIGEAAGVPVEVSHVKLSGPANWRRLEALLAVLDDAPSRGVPVGFDQYPYVASGTWLIALLPRADQQGGAAAVARRLADPATRARLHADLAADPAGWEERSGVAGWSGIVVGQSPGDEAASGRSLADLAAERGRHPLDVALDLIVAGEGQADATFFDQSEEVVRALLAHPLVAVGSDGWSVAPDGPLADLPEHPRSYGTFPRVLGRYVREQRALSLAEAVRKMTSLTAERFGLIDRGVVREGAVADLVLFDTAAVADRATFADPKRFPDGLACVLVGGRVVLRDGERTAALPGRVL